MGKGLGHDGGAYDNPLRVGLLDDTTAPGGIDAGRQRRLHDFFFNALSPAREAGRVDGQLGLQVGLTAEELPVRVPYPRFIPLSRQRRRRCAAGTAGQRPSAEPRLGGHNRR